LQVSQYLLHDDVLGIAFWTADTVRTHEMSVRRTEWLCQRVRTCRQFRDPIRSRLMSKRRISTDGKHHASELVY
jgi:hypothetical protein